MTHEPISSIERAHGARSATGVEDPAGLVAAAVEPLPDDFDSEAFAAAFDRYADRRVVLLGEASHGTSEFYRARAAITRRLVERHGFGIVAVEADWPDAAIINRHVRGLPQREGQGPVFQRFPTWMWRNVEVAALVGWLRAHNAQRPEAERAGFYGLDMYSLGASIEAVLAYLDDVDPEAATEARQRYGCLTPWQQDPAGYGHAVMARGYRGCEDAVVRQCRELLARRHALADGDDAATAGEDFLDAAQNARLVASAERYYRTMYYGGAESWNLRDTHMFETLCQLLDARPGARAVVWAHNSHIGDARQTETGRRRGELNIGQLRRERFGDDCALVGFGTHAGEVAAADDWGDAMAVMQVRPSRAGSVERLLHDTGIARGLLDLERARHDPALRDVLGAERLERFIGVIYRPATELQSHYAGVSLLGQFDGYVWSDRTSAVTPLGPQQPQDGVPETWPSGL